MVVEAGTVAGREVGVGHRLLLAGHGQRVLEAREIAVAVVDRKLASYLAADYRRRCAGLLGQAAKMEEYVI